MASSQTSDHLFSFYHRGCPLANRLRFDPSVTPEERPGPTGGRRAKNRVERTQALCEAALQQFTDTGIDGTRIDGISQAAGISKSAFYRYFEHKTAIVDALFSALSDRVIASLESTREALERAESPDQVQNAYASMAADLVELFLAEPELVRLFLQERHGAPTEARQPVLDLDEKITEHARQLTLTAQTSGWIRPFDPNVSAVAVLGAIYELLWRRLRMGSPGLEDLDAAQQLVDLVLYGVQLRDDP